MIRRSRLRTLTAAATLLVLPLILVPTGSDVVAQQVPVITVDDTVEYQTMTGWEATTQAGQWFLDSFDDIQEEMLDALVDDLGVNRVRMELRAGVENPTDYFARVVIGEDGANPLLDPVEANSLLVDDEFLESVIALDRRFAGESDVHFEKLLGLLSIFFSTEQLHILDRKRESAKGFGHLHARGALRVQCLPPFRIE